MTVFVGVVLAVDVKPVESRNMSNVYPLNRSQSKCFIIFTFYSILSGYSYLCVLNGLLVHFSVEFE